jgi:hypothetical protein
MEVHDSAGRAIEATESETSHEADREYSTSLDHKSSGETIKQQITSSTASNSIEHDNNDNNDNNDNTEDEIEGKETKAESFAITVTDAVKEEDSECSRSANESIPSQADTDVTSDDDCSLDSISSHSDTNGKNLKEQSHHQDEPPIPDRIDGRNLDDGYQNDSSSSLPSGENVPIESQLEEKHDMDLEFDAGLPNDGSVVSAIRINDSFCDSASFRMTQEYDTGNEVQDQDQVQTRRLRKVNFCEKIVTEVKESTPWTAEEKSYLFYTGKEMHQFRIEYMMELHESYEDTWGECSQRGGIRLFLSMYTILLDFFTCKAVVQFCCGNPDKIPVNH